MKKRWILAPLIAANVFLAGYRLTSPGLKVEELVNIGGVFDQENKPVTFRVDNAGIRPLKILSVAGGCSCIGDEKFINHGNFSEISFSLHPIGQSAGKRSAKLILKTNDPKKELVEIKLAYMVKTHLQISPNRIEILTPIGNKDKSIPIHFESNVDLISDTGLTKPEVIGLDNSVQGRISKTTGNKYLLELNVHLLDHVDEFERRLLVKTADGEASLKLVAIRR